MNAILTCSCLAWSPHPETQEGRFALKPRGKKKAKKSENPRLLSRHFVEMALD